MDAMAVPITPGKLAAWEGWIAEMSGPRKAELDDMNERYGLSLHAAWLQPTPDGNHLVVVVFDGPGSAEFMQKVAKSDHEFDAWFRSNVEDVHPMDFSGPLPPPPERRV